VAKNFQRRLAAILAADVVGYSRLMGEDEAGTLARLKSLRRELVQPKITERKGRIVKLMGDGLLAEFPSVVEAVKCAVDIQQDMAAREADVPEERRIRLRIGVNLGDIIVEGSDIYGDGVNVAARLESLAEPGGICISGKVYEEIGSKLPTAFEDLGEQEVKNIPKPVRVYRWIDAPADPMPGAEGALPLPEKPSIAVLPFVNMSADPEQEFFADGITEDIITELSRFKDLLVIARNSSFAFKGEARDVKEIGRKLGVRYVVEGSVRRAGDRVRVTAQLIDAVNDSHLWAERYDRELTDIFALQDEVTRAIVTAVAPQLASVERERAKRKPPDSLDVWECYQRGLWHLYHLTAEHNPKAKDFFGRANALDPGFATSHAALAYALYVDVIMGFVSEPGDSLQRGLTEARLAVSLDDGDAFGYLALGKNSFLLGHNDAAMDAYRKALVINPNLAMAHHGLGLSLCMIGHAEEAIASFDEAAQSSPRDPIFWAFLMGKSLAMYCADRYEEGLALAAKARQQPNGEAVIWAYLSDLDRKEEAHAALEAARKIKPDLSFGFFEMALPWHVPELKERFTDGLRKAGLPE
jgi:adenylate cyclase